MAQGETTHFRQMCEQAGLAVTHQRQVIYEVLRSIDGHPSPEEVYARVKRRIPSISLATVYKNLHLFIGSGIFQQVSLHHGSMRVETNQAPHHHLLCTRCKAILDIEPELLGLAEMPRQLPSGFRMERVAVDVLGICAGCQAGEAQNASETPVAQVTDAHPYGPSTALQQPSGRVQ
jgi:Fur family peroxide stress response transcriptional regulator